MANWYLCEVTRANGALPIGATKGKKVYCKKVDRGGHG
jgi:hypothetical protein